MENNVKRLSIDRVCKYFCCNTVDSAWLALYEELASQNLSVESRDGKVCGELINPIVEVLDPTRNIVTNDIRNMSMRYAVGELLWYLSGSNKLSDIAKFSSAWQNLSDDGQTINSAYGYRIFNKFGFNQLSYVRELLLKDPNTRQAVIHIKDADDKSTKDVPCTLTLQFLLRDNRLNLIANMRSNDIWLGFPYDVFSFTSIQMITAMSLGVDVGTYVHMAGSMHLYERNKKQPEKTLKTKKSCVPLVPEGGVDNVL